MNLLSDGILSLVGLEPLVGLSVVLVELLGNVWADVPKLLLQLESGVGKGGGSGGEGGRERGRRGGADKNTVY